MMVASQLLEFPLEVLVPKGVSSLLEAELLQEVRLELVNRVLSEELHLPHEALPLLALLQEVGSLGFLPKQQEFRKVLRVLEIFIFHLRLPLNDHLDLDFVALRDHLGHAVLVALLDHGDDEVHEDHVAHDYRHQPSHPG